MKRMADHRLPKKINEWFPKWRRNRGGQKLNRTQDNAQTMREWGLDDGAWEERDGWD